MLSVESPTLAPALPYARPRLHATATVKLSTMATAGWTAPSVPSMTAMAPARMRAPSVAARVR